MKFSAREDIDAPIESVFEAVSDFDAFERRKVAWRGRVYDVDAELVALEPGEGYTIESRSNGIESSGVVELVALSKTRTRMFVSIDLRPVTLSARLLVQSLRLAKGNLSRRFKTRVHEFAKGLTG